MLWKTNAIKQVIKSSMGSSNCSLQELIEAANESGMTKDELLVHLGNTVLNIYQRSQAFSKNETLAQRIMKVIKSEDKLIVFWDDSISELLKALSMSKEKFMQLILNVAMTQYIFSIDKIKEVEHLREENKDMKSVIYYLQSRTGQRVNQNDLIRNGVKPALKPEASIEAINRLKALGFSDEKIAATLNISRATLWRRRKAYQERQKRIQYLDQPIQKYKYSKDNIGLDSF